MRPLFAASSGPAAACVVATLVLAPVVRAQQWNDARTMALVDLAVARRAAQLADTGLADYRANAHGSVTFLAQLGEGFPDPPKVVRTDELAVEVYWRAPNQSKQRIVGRRDTLLLPTDIAYHRDHLAIVQNNFPAVIRVGDGDEVLDVPHPLSAAGRLAYDFAITDSLLIRTADRAFDVLELKVRPRDERQPRAVGALYLDRANAAVVRMTVSFTRAALKDPQLEDVSIILENGLVEGRFWLPRRQEVEIRRVGSWMEFPARGVIRGRWEICCVEVNRGLSPALFAGPEIVAAPAAQQLAYPFTGTILQSLPGDVRLAENDDVRHVQEEARALVRAAALARTRGTTPYAGSVSDLLRMNRIEGVAVGLGASRALGQSAGIRVRGRYGFSDRALKGSLTLALGRAGGSRISLSARDDFRDAGDEPETSGLRNSLAAQEFGADLTSYYRARGAELALDGGDGPLVRWHASIGRERQDPLATHAQPAQGVSPGAFGAARLTAWRLGLEASRPAAPGPFGSTLAARGSLLLSREGPADSGLVAGDRSFARVAIASELERAFGNDRVVLAMTAAAVAGRNAPPQAQVFLGGPVSGPGFDYHAFGSSAGATAHLEWRHRLADLPVSLGRFGRLGMPFGVAPFLHAIWIDPVSSGTGSVAGWYPSAGFGVITLFDFVRFDVARGLRGGRWTFAVDFSRDYWRIL